MLLQQVVLYGKAPPPYIGETSINWLPLGLTIASALAVIAAFLIIRRRKRRKPKDETKTRSFKYGQRSGTVWASLKY